MAGIGGAAETSVDFPQLFSPLRVGDVELRNRLVMGSMHTGLEDHARDLDRLAAFYAERARGGVGLIVTGGYAPTRQGWLTPFSSRVTRRLAARHASVTQAVHDHGARIVLQLLHAGRYGYHPLAVGASTRRSPITPFRPRALTSREVDRTATAFARAAGVAARAGYDGVEIMGSEGYLINQFLVSRTNDRDDAWGGSPQRRMRLAVEVARRVREELGDGPLVQFRLSLLDLVEDGQTWDETIELAHRLEAVGVSTLASGIGWHEARVPTIVASVPRAAFSSLAARLRAEVALPVVASNRIVTPADAERLLAEGAADLISMARPWLADGALGVKAASGRADLITPCIACNQACLDHTFARQPVSCLLNPRAGHETLLTLAPTRADLRVAVVGAGPAGLACAVELAGRGYRVTLIEADESIGGQLRLAARIPGKEEFREALAYYARMIEATGVELRLGERATVEGLRGFDRVVLATGVEPRVPDIPGIDHPSVLSYPDVVAGRVQAGRRVAILGAGGIGVDVAELLVRGQDESLEDWRRRWGVGDPAVHRGGLVPRVPIAPAREVTLLQRRPTPVGAGLGRTTGWVHRATLRDAGVTMLRGIEYRGIDDAGLAISEPVDPEDPSRGRRDRVLPVDSIVVCTGQESVRDLLGPLREAGVAVEVIGGADVAAELDAKRAIRQATELAARL